MPVYITESQLRERSSLSEGSELRLAAGECLTPAARGLLAERRIRVRYVDAAGRVFLDDDAAGGDPAQRRRRVHPLTGSSERREAQCTLCHQAVLQKPDTLTHLDATRLVVKNDPRIRLRGKIDTAIAYAVWIEAESSTAGATAFTSPPALPAALAEVRAFLGTIMRCDVSGEPLPAVRLGDLDEAAIHAVSHDPLKHLGHDHIVPEVAHGVTAARLNLLRTTIREAELCAAEAYIGADFEVRRPDILQGLNRLSSAVYILMIRALPQAGGRSP